MTTLDARNLLRIAETPDEAYRYDSVKIAAQHKENQKRTEAAEAVFEASKQQHLKILCQHESFWWFMDNLVLPEAVPPRLNGNAKIDEKVLYAIIKADVLGSLYEQYLAYKQGEDYA